MLHRLRARIQFAEGSGLAAWAKAQMDVRYGQAVHINEGLANEETKINYIDGEYFVCDLPLMDQSAAEDAVATLSDPTVLGVSLLLPNDVAEEQEQSYVEHHQCYHDEHPSSSCVVVTKNLGPAEPVVGSEWQAGVAYATNDEVTYQGTSYKCLQGHTSQVGWEPPNVPALWQAL